MDKVALAVGAVLLGGAGVAVWSALATEPDGHVVPDTAALAQGAPLAEVALPAELSAEAQIGKRAFEAKCAVCHGPDAAGQNGVAPPLVHQIYEPGHHSDAAFLSAARNGVPAHHWSFGDMPPIAGLSDADVKYIARYVRELQRENGIF